ncbi:hypothetical protein D3C77_594700 [compost metagenome]
MPNKLRLACVTALLLLICGCQSYSTPPPRVVTVGCQPPPAAPAWFMEPFEPTLTQDMLNELSASPIEATKD